jgi:hypothetical protein
MEDPMLEMDAAPELITFVAAGEITTSELLRAYRLLLDGPPTKSLWDLSSATTARIPAEDVRDLADDVRRITRGRRPPGRSAVVCSRGVDYGLARMFSMLLDDTEQPLKLAVFHELRDARAWLSAGGREGSSGTAQRTDRQPEREALMERRPRKQRGTVQTTKDLTSQIQERAYAIFLQREREGLPGDPVSDWCAAEREVRSHSIVQEQAASIATGVK